MMTAARSSVTGTLPDARTRPTSWRLRRWRDSAEIDEFHAIPSCERSHNILLAHEALLDQLPQDASRTGFDAGLLNLSLGD